MLSNKNPATRNRTRDHLIAAALYSQMLYQLSYSRLYYIHEGNLELNYSLLEAKSAEK